MAESIKDSLAMGEVVIRQYDYEREEASPSRDINTGSVELPAYLLGKTETQRRMLLEALLVLEAEARIQDPNRESVLSYVTPSGEKITIDWSKSKPDAAERLLAKIATTRAIRTDKAYNFAISSWNFSGVIEGGQHHTPGYNIRNAQELDYEGFFDNDAYGNASSRVSDYPTSR